MLLPQPGTPSVSLDRPMTVRRYAPELLQASSIEIALRSWREVVGQIPFLVRPNRRIYKYYVKSTNSMSDELQYGAERLTATSPRNMTRLRRPKQDRLTWPVEAFAARHLNNIQHAKSVCMMETSQPRVRYEEVAVPGQSTW